MVETLKRVLGMSEEAARNWFNGTETVETSIAQLVSEIRDYVNSKPDNYRLLFMIDDVGRILRTFKIKKNVEVTDNGKIII